MFPSIVSSNIAGGVFQPISSQTLLYDGDSRYRYSSLGRGEDAVAREGDRWYGGVDVDIIGGGWARVQSGQHHCLNWDRSDVIFEQTGFSPLFN
jgi:hypothetical protein